MGHIKGTGEAHPGKFSVCAAHILTDEARVCRVGVLNDNLILTVQNPAVQLQGSVGASEVIALVHGVPLTEPHMTRVGPLSAVNTQHRNPEGLDVNDVVIICKQAAPSGMSDQLQAVHVGVDGQNCRGEHRFQALINDPRVLLLFRQGQTSVQQHLLSHIIEVLSAQLALVELT